jgi:hypothetical protein
VPAMSPAIVMPLMPVWVKLFASPKSVTLAMKFGDSPVTRMFDSLMSRWM